MAPVTPALGYVPAWSQGNRAINRESTLYANRESTPPIEYFVNLGTHANRYRWHHQARTVVPRRLLSAAWPLGIVMPFAYCHEPGLKITLCHATNVKVLLYC